MTESREAVFAAPSMSPTPYEQARMCLNDLSLLLRATKTQVLSDVERTIGLSDIKQLSELILRLKGPSEHD